MGIQTPPDSRATESSIQLRIESERSFQSPEVSCLARRILLLLAAICPAVRFLRRLQRVPQSLPEVTNGKACTRKSGGNLQVCLQALASTSDKRTSAFLWSKFGSGEKSIFVFLHTIRCPLYWSNGYNKMAPHASRNRCGWHLLVKKCHLYLNCGAVLSRPPVPGGHSDTALYLRRFAVDHWYRFIKQRLHWTLPKLATPQQSDRWSDLMPLMTWELWQARDIVNCLSAPVAETDDSIYARTGCTSYAWDFGHSFYSCQTAKTTR